MLCSMLKEYESGAMAHLDEREQESILASIKRRIADIDLRMKAFNGQEGAPRRAGPKA
ncbi:MAG TPA: hypothetical protein VGM04_05355 [Sphingomicrobium sp.]|jgi:hypothetical protein